MAKEKTTALSFLASMFLYCCAVFNAGDYLNLRASVLHDLAAQTGSTPSGLGVFLLMNGMGGMASAIPAGFMADTLDPHLLIIFGLGLRALVAAAIPFTKSLLVLCVLGFLGGCGNSATAVGTNSCVVWLNDRYAEDNEKANKGTMGASLGVLTACFGLGSIVGPLIYSALETRVQPGIGVYGVYWGVAIWSSVLMLLLSLRRSPGRTRTAPENSADEGDAITPDDRQGCAKFCLRLFRKLFPTDSWRIVLLLSVYLFLAVAVEMTLGSWIVEFAVGTGRADRPTAAIANSTLWIAFTVARLVASALSLLLPPMAILTTANAIMVAALACSLVFKSGWTLWVLVIGFGIGVAPVYPNGMALGRQYCVFTGTIQSFFGLAAQMGNLGPAAAGVLQEHFGWYAVIWLSIGGVAALQCTLFALVAVGNRTTKQRDQADPKQEKLLADVVLDVGDGVPEAGDNAITNAPIK